MELTVSVETLARRFMLRGRACALSVVLVCAACGGATYTPPAQYIYVTVPVPSGLGPAELQRASDMATNTQAAINAQLTQDARAGAQATSTEESARATSTTSARETADSLMVVQTQSALAITAGAGQALATNAAAVHTAQADETAAAATPTAHALQVAVAATGTQLARQAETSVRREALDDEIAAAWRWALVVIGGIILLAGGLVAIFGISDILSSVAAIKRAEATRAQAEAMQLWIMHYGGRILQLKGGNSWEEMQPAQLAAPAPPAEPVETNIREVPVRAHGEVVSSIDLTEPETPERLRVLHLLTLAISIAGPNAGFVPSADRLGMHRQEWQTALDSLKAGPGRPAYVMTSAGRPKAGQAGRTRLCQPAYMTLGALRDGITRGDVLPPPSLPAPVSVS